MDTTIRAVIDNTIEKHNLRTNHDTAGDLVDCLKEDGEKMTAQHLLGQMSANDLLSRSSLILNFLRDIETDFVTVAPKEIIIPKGSSSIKVRCNGWDNDSPCPNRASILIITNTDPAIAFGLCTDHQRGDLSKVPTRQARALPWEDERTEHE